MKLTAKLVAAVVSVIAILLLVDGYLLVQRERELLKAEIRTDALIAGKILKTVLLDAWQEGGKEHALGLIKGLRKEDSFGVRWLSPEELPREPTAGLSSGAMGMLRRGEIVFSSDQETDQLLTYVPISHDKLDAVLEFSESMARVHDSGEAASTRALVLAVAILLTSTLVIGIMGARMVGQPLRDLAERARRIGQGDLTSHIQLRSGDELEQLAETMNSMCAQLIQARDQVRVETEARLAAMEKLRHEDRLRTVGQIASGIAHELGTPLNVISGRASMILSGNLPTKQYLESAQAIKTQAKRMTEIIQRLLDFARRRHPVKTKADIAELILQTVRLLNSFAEKRQTKLEVDVPAETTLASLDPGQIQQVLSNLIMNAIQSMSDGGVVKIGVDRATTRHPQRDVEDREYLRIWIRDEGKGVLDEDLPHLFEPFFTTKEVGQGTGLGLSIAHGIIEEHGGWFDIKSEIGEGSFFAVFLPMEEQ